MDSPIDTDCTDPVGVEDLPRVAMTVAVATAVAPAVAVSVLLKPVRPGREEDAFAGPSRDRRT